ncbi:MAG: alpha-galactosidase [Candidatus Hydrogenedentes bacterium]|nr:alpha-galactosidase [Candidatus Hydrogenedentota bacterium]
MGGVILTALLAQMMCSAAPEPAELAEAGTWVRAKFEGVAEEIPQRTNSITVFANNDPVQPNGRHAQPMRIVDKTYDRGLYCHAVSKLLIRLARPGKTFEAVAGVDTNEQTSGGRGSVVFGVHAGGKELWHSELMREGMPGVPVSVDLGGAAEFVLTVGDGGDGIGCDQSDWADARVTLDDGSVCWLGDLPLNEHARAPYDAAPFFAFTYGGRPSSEFLESWTLKRESRALDANRMEYTLTYTDPKTALEVRCVGVAYSDFPSVEWTLYFKNGGSADTPILSDILAIDTRFDRASTAEFVLHQNRGDNCVAESFEPFENTLGPGVTLPIANTGGRPTQSAFPYFNLAAGNEGLIFVFSWAGLWRAEFARDAAHGIQLRAGQELTHFTLHPGETVRTPMIVLQFWKGSVRHAQNVWRSWMIVHNIPRPGGQLPPLPMLNACSSHQYGEMINADSASQIMFVDNYLARDIKLDYWWMDAGWYFNKTGWPHTGTWEVDTNRFPGGLRPITDHAHAKGVKSIVWFEPERVTGDTWITNTHPEWVLGGKDGGLLNLGDPEVLEWLTNHVDGLLTSEGIDLYRQDFNMDPLDFWRRQDTEDRQGITENKHVVAYFAYWDALRRRHPDMLIDSCASGGRRNDLETLRRAAPLLRSDYIMEPVGNQCHTYTLSSWFPFYGTGTSKTDTYLVRSTLCPSFTACWDQRDPNLDWANLARLVHQWKAYGPNYFGDYYPLTPYSLKNDQWIGWQFHRPDVNEGMVQVFRRADSLYESIRLPLEGLDSTARYRVTDIDAPDNAKEFTGEELAREGVSVAIAEKPGTAFLVYKRLD